MTAHSKFLIFHDLEQRVTGTYTDSPGHISLLRPLYIADEYDRLIAGIHDVALRTEPFAVLAGTSDRFGIDRDIEVVRIVDCDGGLQAIHSRLMSELGRRGLDYLIDMKWSGDAYSPHYTVVDGFEFPQSPYMVENLSYYLRDSENHRHIVRVPFGACL